MGRESLWGWFCFGLILSMVAASVIVISTGAPMLLVGILLGVLGVVVLQVTTIGIGVQIGMARHEHLKSRARPTQSRT